MAGKFPTSLPDATRLAALYLQLNYGDSDIPGNRYVIVSSFRFLWLINILINRDRVKEGDLKKYISKEHLSSPEVSPAQLMNIISIPYSLF